MVTLPTDFFIVCFCSGAGGDLISCLLDPTDYRYDETNQMLISLTRRKNLLKDLPSQNYVPNRIYKYTHDDFDQITLSLSGLYSAIPSHHHEYNASRHQQHVILVDDSSERDSRWSNSRISQIYRGDKWVYFMTREVRTNCYQMVRPYVNKVLKTQDIVEGRLIDILRQWTDRPLDQQLYEKWLKQVLAKYPY